MSQAPLRIIFMGTPDFAAEALGALLQGPDQIVAVVTQPDRPKGRGKKLSPPPVKIVAENAGLPVLQPTKIKTDTFREELQSYKPDVMVVAAYGRILPKSLLELASHGCLNIHGSLLPAHRGAAPIQWSVINGDEKTGITIMQMDEGMDTGDMLLQSAIPVTDTDTAGSMFDKLSALGGKTIREALVLLKQDKLKPEKQDESLATNAPMLKKEDGIIDWKKSARDIHCLIRGLDPWPSAYCFYEGKRMRLFCPEVVHRESKETPGTLLQADKRGLLFATGSDCLLIREIQPEGKKRMPVESFLCGTSLSPGADFASQ
jgi:methionyl-tRNA formyltransferase